MGRKWFMLWHALSSLAGGVLYFYCVLPRWYELTGDMPRGLGMAGRITSGALIGLAALPVVFVLLRSRKPELGTPQLALTMRVWSIVAHVLAGVLIIGTAISEIWLSLDDAGRYLFGIYGAAAAVAVLGIFAFYLSLFAELPPPPPKPIKAKKPGKRRLRRKKGDEAAPEELEELEETAPAEDAELAEVEAGETEEAQAEEPAEPVEVTAESAGAEPEPEPPSGETPPAGDTEADEDADARAGLRNRRPIGKGSHRMRRRRTRGGVALDD
jgi:hypothetical protein